MFLITADPHGQFETIEQYCNAMKTNKTIDTMIVLGDSMINYYQNHIDIERKEKLKSISINFFLIKGNHEIWPDVLDSNTFQTKIWNDGLVYYEEQYSNILYAKDGEIYNINGYKTIVIGGAHSVDKRRRLENQFKWFESEQISAENIRYVESQLEKNNWNIDIVLSHTCPKNVMPLECFATNIEQTDIDNTMEDWLQTLADKLTFKKWYFGHFHNYKVIDNYKLLYDTIETLYGTYSD